MKKDFKVAEGRSPRKVETSTSQDLLNQPTVHLMLSLQHCCSECLLLHSFLWTKVVASFHGVENTRLAVARPPSVPKTWTCTEHHVCSEARQDAHREEVFKDLNYSLCTIMCTSCLFEHPTMQQVHHASAENRPQLCTSRLFEHPNQA